MNRYANRIDRAKFLGGFGMLTLAACSGGGANILANTPQSSTKNPDIVIDPCPDCVPVVPTLPTNMSALTTAEVAALTAAEIAALSGDQIGSFTNEQLHYITNAQAFHGSQAEAILQRVAAVGQVLPVPNPWIQGTPPPYVPATPASNFWTWFGEAIGGVVGSAAGALASGPAGFFVGAAGSIAGSTLGGYLFGPQDALFCFYNTDMGEWQGVDLGPSSNFVASTEDGNTGQSSLDSDGVTVMGSFSAGCSPDDTKRRLVDSSGCDGTVTVTVIAN